ncbi:hypothetical protein ES703_59019 [subsurface metagenome]
MMFWYHKGESTADGKTVDHEAVIFHDPEKTYCWGTPWLEFEYIKGRRWGEFLGNSINVTRIPIINLLLVYTGDFSYWAKPIRRQKAINLLEKWLPMNPYLEKYVKRIKTILTKGDEATTQEAEG